MKMKKGDRVRVYHDPFTRGSMEGKATLVKYYKDAGFYDSEGYDMWEVKFDGDEHTSIRKFSQRDII